MGKGHWESRGGESEGKGRGSKKRGRAVGSRVERA